MISKKRNIFFSAIGGGGFGFCLASGKSLDVNYTLNLTDAEFYVRWLFLSLCCMVVLWISWSIADRIFCAKRVKSAYFVKAESFVERLEQRIPFWGCSFLLILCWLPVWFSLFPGAFSYDAYDEWMQVCTGDLTAHHPVLHVLYLGGIVEGIYRLLGSYNIGIAVSIFIQMVILAGVFSYSIEFLKERGVSPLLRLFAFLFYGFSPVVGLFSVCCTKDTLFTAAFLMFVISIYRLSVQSEQFFENKKWMVLFIISAIFTMIMRNNGMYIVLCTLALGVLPGRKRWKRYALICLTVLLTYGIYVGPFYSGLGVTPGGKAEMLSVPLQQLARVYHYEKETLSAEQLEYMHLLVPEENWNAYRFTVSDYVKSGFSQEVFEQEPGNFFRLWIEVGMDHPLSYINSFLIGTVDFWYPFSIVDGYQDVYGKSSYFDYRVSEPGTEYILLPRVHEMLDYISHEKEAQAIPGIFLLLSPGWYLFLFFALLLYQWRNKRYDLLLVLFPLLINFGTVLLGPIALVRYVLILFWAFPIYSAMLGNNN